MVNTVIVVGKLVDIKPIDDLNFFIYIRVDRSFKEITGGFKSDILPVKVWKGVVDSLDKEKYNDFIISISGRIESDGTNLTLVGEKFEFLGRSNRFIKGGN